jgi:uncharacterized membrane protein
MSLVEEGIEVQAPVKTVYNQWTQFEDFPRFMEGVEEVRQLDDQRLQWRADVGGAEREWQARIVEQDPDKRIAWTSEEGAFTSGVVTFHRLDDDRSRIMLQMEFRPEDIVEAVGDKLGFVRRRVKGDLERFKEFIEERGTETGGWRGDIEQDEVRKGDPNPKQP